ncbi:XdhC family protein [Microbacterium karelineae]|uniref:XdhC family protein n=1 Tax=Microbacterium karelineae TaxID=2654283 RepID=UPI0012EA24DA|nr:XdhC family protein [Microbacterium karelineae]
MRDVLPVAAQWVREGREFAIATVVGIRGSAPRELGASMLIGGDGTVFGNVSGGCVDSAVAAEGAEAIGDGLARLGRYGVDDDPLHGIALTCGGEIDVLVRPVAPDDDAARQLCALAAADGAIGCALEITGDEMGRAWIVGDGVASDGADRATARMLADAGALVGGDRARLLSYDADGCRADGEDRSVLVVPFGSAPRLIVVGAVEFAVPLTRLAAALGFRGTIVDARPAFSSPERFPDAEVVVSWPDRYLGATDVDARTAICVLTHDDRFDVPALRVALGGPAGYVGAMGSRVTHDDRLRRLAESGVPTAQITRLRSPIGLDLGGRSAEETALSILAEIVAHRNGATGLPLSERAGPVHLIAPSP